MEEEDDTASAFLPHAVVLPREMFDNLNHAGKIRQSR